MAADNPNVGPDPVQAEPNTLREKTYKPANVPERVEAEVEKLPEKTAEEKVSKDMPKAVDEVRKRI